MMKHHFEKIISKNFLEIGSFSKSKYIAVRKGKTQSEREVLQMQDAMREEKPAPVEQATDEELFEVLIAISVVAKQLAKKVIQKGDNHEQNERTGHGA